jgi:hypothetical protein
MGNGVTNKSGSQYGQASQNGREDIGERFKSNRKKKIITYVLKSTKKDHSRSA